MLRRVIQTMCAKETDFSSLHHQDSVFTLQSFHILIHEAQYHNQLSF